MRPKECAWHEQISYCLGENYGRRKLGSDGITIGVLRTKDFELAELLSSLGLDLKLHMKLPEQIRLFNCNRDLISREIELANLRALKL